MQFKLKLVAGLALVGVTSAMAQAPDPVRWSVAVVPTRGGDAAVVTLAVTASIEPGWKVYSLTQTAGGPFPLRIAPGAESVSLAGTVTGPAPSVQETSAFGIPVEVYGGQPRFVVPVRVGPGGSSTEAALKVRYQACTETTCLPPRTTTVVAQLTGGR
ncbi:MAG: protein-disulfide reductase DsbD domain-containing protein [Gemmatimonadales bacterium]